MSSRVLLYKRVVSNGIDDGYHLMHVGPSPEQPHANGGDPNNSNSETDSLALKDNKR
jgi:hypothetical protein